MVFMMGNESEKQGSPGRMKEEKEGDQQSGHPLPATQI
jgi:hypothetical protein